MKNYKVAKLKGLNCSQNLFIEVNVVIRTCLETCLGSRNFQMKIERNKFFPYNYKTSSLTGIICHIKFIGLFCMDIQQYIKYCLT